MIGEGVLGVALTEVKHVLYKNNTAERRVHWLMARKSIENSNKTRKKRVRF
jgi:hypothetical protein